MRSIRICLGLGARQPGRLLLLLLLLLLLQAWIWIGQAALRRLPGSLGNVCAAR